MDWYYRDWETSEYDSKYLSHISEIKFCPYCGKELEEVEE